MPEQAVSVQHHGKTDREEDLKLDHERGEPRRHAELDPEKEKPELAHTDRKAIGEDAAPRHRRRSDEKHHWNGCHEEPDCGERERRYLGQGDLDRDERVAPDRDDGERQREIARG